MQLLIGIIAAIVVVGGGAYVAMNPEVMTSITGGSAEGDAMMGNENEQENASVGRTFAEIVALGQSVTCTFNYDDGTGNSSSGTVYMTGGGEQMRGDFFVESPVAMEAHMIRTGGYNYMWSDAMPQAIKTKVTNEAELMTEGADGGVNENTQFACQAWSVDNSKFTLPAGVEFVDISAQVDASVNATVPGASVNASGSASVKAQQCAACNMIPDASAKAQCLAALAC